MNNGLLNQNIKSNISACLIEICNGPIGCSNSIYTDTEIRDKIENLLKKLKYEEFISEKIKVPFKRHNRLTISISYCPNSCSRPQIADIGIIGARAVMVTDNKCSGCGECVNVCFENAISLNEKNGISIDFEKCLYCGKCYSTCQTGTIEKETDSYRIQIGGKLGRHPRLAAELPGIFKSDEIINIIEEILRLLMENYPNARCCADLFTIYDENTLIGKLLK